MADQAWFFLWTMVLGAVSGVVYDIFRIIRKIIRHPDFFTQIEDFLYWILTSILIFYFILHYNSGEVRVYAVIGVFSGMCLYFFTLSKLLIAICVFIIDILKKIIITSINIILLPLKILVRVLSYPARAIKRWCIKKAWEGKALMRHTSRFAGIRMLKLKKEMHIIRKKI